MTNACCSRNCDKTASTALFGAYSKDLAHALGTATVMVVSCERHYYFHGRSAPPNHVHVRVSIRALVMLNAQLCPVSSAGFY